MNSTEVKNTEFIKVTQFDKNLSYIIISEWKMNNKKVYELGTEFHSIITDNFNVLLDLKNLLNDYINSHEKK